MYKHWIIAACGVVALSACGGKIEADADAGIKSVGETVASKTDAKMDPWEMDMSEKVELTEEEWRARLTEEQFQILRKKGTERAGTGEYAQSKKEGIYHCAGCGNPLFDSDTKYESGTGWPSFWKPVKDGHVAEEEDNSLWAKRTEVLCDRCGGHLGHVFTDGPQPTGLRYCINSASLKLVESKTADEEKAESDEAK